MDRRNFLKTGGLALLGSLATGSAMALTTPGALGGEGADKKTAIALAMNYFGVSESDLKKVLTAALEKGANYADLFFEHTITNSIHMMDGAVNNSHSNIDYGVGVRVQIGTQRGYAYVENFTLEDMLKAARTAARIASADKGNKPLNLTEKELKKNYYSIASTWEEVSLKDKMPYLQKLNDRIFALDKRVHKVQVKQKDITSHIFFCNSEGVMFYDYRPLVSLGAMCIMEEDGKTENDYASRAYRRGFDFLSDEVVEVIAREVVDRTSFLFKATKPKGGEMPVVVGGGESGILLHEAVGHTLEADLILNDISIFADQLNKKVCNEHINVVDDGTIPFNLGSVNFDDEGTEGQKTYLIKDGVLTSCMHDRMTAKIFGVKPTGNGRRESFRNRPIPRMCATYMEAGNVNESDIISSVKKGIFVDSITNGEVEMGVGNFTFFVKSGYMIEDGQLTRPIKDVNIIGNGPKALADITMVANNTTVSNALMICGKYGQSCPVTCGMPSVLVGKLTVGGEN